MSSLASEAPHELAFPLVVGSVLTLRSLDKWLHVDWDFGLIMLSTL